MTSRSSRTWSTLPLQSDRCGLIDTLATAISRLERQISKLAKPDPRVAALMACPGSVGSPP